MVKKIKLSIAVLVLVVILQVLLKCATTPYYGSMDEVTTESCKTIRFNVTDIYVNSKANTNVFDYMRVSVENVVGNSNDADSANAILNAAGMKTAVRKISYPRGLGYSCEEMKREDYFLFGPHYELPLYKDNGQEITDPEYLIGKEMTFKLEFLSGSEKWSYEGQAIAKDANTNIVKPPTPMLTQTPVLRVGEFDEDNCSCDLTVSYIKEIAGAYYSVYLYSSPERLNPASGELKVDPLSKKDITTQISSSGVYTWVANAGEANKNTPQYFQVGVSAKQTGYAESAQKMSELGTCPNVSCVKVAPVVEVRSIKNRDSVEINYASDVIDLKTKTPLFINVFAKTDDTEIPSSIKVEVSYDSTEDRERADFYLGRHPADNILRTIIDTPSVLGSGFIYEIPWDGRDGFDNRILLGGDYNIKATATFGVSVEDTVLTKKLAGATGEHAITVHVEKVPNFVNVGESYPDIDDTLINKARTAYRLGAYNFDNVSFLEEADTTFEWLRRFSLLSNDCELEEYSRMNRGGPFNITEDLMDAIKDSAAIFSFIGHAGVNPGGTGALKFTGNWLFPECTVDDYQYWCTSGDYCLDYDCDGNVRGRIFKDVLLAVLLGCRTGIGNPSVASKVDESGANCVIATKTRVDYMAMNFWYREFNKQLFVDEKIIEKAASEGYDTAITDIAKFFVQIPDNASFERVQEYLGKYRDPDTGDSLFYVQEYDSTFQIIDHFMADTNKVSKQKIVPARYGRP
jgi:hypothetical protein